MCIKSEGVFYSQFAISASLNVLRDNYTKEGNVRGTSGHADISSLVRSYVLRHAVFYISNRGSLLFFKTTPPFFQIRLFHRLMFILLLLLLEM